MITRNTYRILIWAIIILLATNLSMGFSFLYHKLQGQKVVQQTEQTTVEIPAEQRTRFFREMLDLNPAQVTASRGLNREFNRMGHQINGSLEQLRIEMVTELGQTNPNDEKLKSISAKIGALHAELKTVTIDYYLEMKAVCTPTQQQKLNEVFMGMLKIKEDVSLPKRGGRNRRNR